jgi:hypothetical protein
MLVREEMINMDERIAKAYKRYKVTKLEKMNILSAACDAHTSN